MIERSTSPKRYGSTVAVDDASFAVRPGRVTGFLGPNGAGKSTTMRMILGLDTPSSGSVLVNDQPYRALTDPLRSVGALLDAKAIVGGRSAAHHLLWLADSNGVTRRRVSEVLDIAGLSDVAGQRVGTFSLGGAMVVTGLDAAAIGQTAAAHAITLLELATRSATLEEAFFDLTRDETDYRAGQLAGSSKGI